MQSIEKNRRGLKKKTPEKGFPAGNAAAAEKRTVFIRRMFCSSSLAPWKGAGDFYCFGK